LITGKKLDIRGEDGEKSDNFKVMMVKKQKRKTI
jgi:hypothetical protein